MISKQFLCSLPHVFSSSAKRGIRALLQPLASAVRTIFICVGIALSPVAHALKIQIAETKNVRLPGDDQMERVGQLKSGSIVEIPDDFTIFSASGKADLEKTLINWLRNAGTTSQGARPFSGIYDGEKRTYFYPVRILAVGKGSDANRLAPETTYYVAFENLAHNGNAIILSNDAPVLKQIGLAPEVVRRKPREVPPAIRANPTAHFEAQAPCTDQRCLERTKSVTLDALVDTLTQVGAVKRANDRLRAAQRRTHNDMAVIEHSLRKSCGLSLSAIAKEVKHQANAAGVPADILLSIMVQESSGRCNILNSETNDSQSVGLFQVNSKSSPYRRCTSGEKKWLYGKSIEQLRTGPACLENPVVNLYESIRILKAKANLLTKPRITLISASGTKETYEGFDPRLMKNSDGTWSDDLWRLAVSAYNGGERWVLRAKSDLTTFNQKHGSRLRADNWEDLRVFYLRRYLDRTQNGHDVYFGNRRTGRSEENSINNLAYAENIVPSRSTTGQSASSSMRKAWAAYLRQI